MTTSLSTSNPLGSEPNVPAEASSVPIGAPDPTVLGRLANEFFAALPGSGGGSFLNVSPVAAINPANLVDLPSDDVLRRIPAGLAGVTGQSPASLNQSSNQTDADTSLYFLKSAEPTSPGVLPILRPDQKGFDPTLSSSAPAAVSASRPLASPTHTSVPGTQHGSTAPHTPGVELGSLPFASAVPPASAFHKPGEEDLRAIPSLLAGAVGSSPQSGLAASGTAVEGTPHYFLDSANQAPPRTTTDVDISPRSVNYDFLPDLGLPRAPGSGVQTPPPGTASLPGEVPKINELSTISKSPVSESQGNSLYFLNDLASHRVAATEETSPAQPELVPHHGSGHPGFDVHAIRRDFPILEERVHGKQLVWFDNAATTQRPNQVIDRISYFYKHENSNIHRAAHELAARATDAYEGAREKVRNFLNASSTDEIVFVRGTTEGINLIAKSWGKRYIGKDDEIVISWLEHHANIVPWQQLCAETGAKLRVIPVDNDGQILLDEYEKLLNSRTKLVSFTQVSNALGTITPAKQMVEIAHRYGAHVLVDGAQSVSHMKVDVQDLNADWFVFSGHKIFGPTGIGAVYGKLDILNATPPWQGGGNMIIDVTHEKTIYHDAPGRFEAGTGNIADAVGLGAAIDYVQRIGMDNINRYEHELVVYATEGLNTVPGIQLVGTAKEKASVVAFVLPGFNNDDIGKELNREGIAVRTGHHCAQPILRRFGHETTVRPSLAFYNTFEEIDRMVETLHRIKGGSTSLRR